MKGRMSTGGLVAAAGLWLSGCTTTQFHDALWESSNDGSIICPSSNDCPTGPDGQQFAGMIIPADIVSLNARLDGETEGEMTTPGGPPPQIVCLATQQRKGCPKGYNGRLWRPSTDQIACQPGDTQGPCATLTNSYAFFCPTGGTTGGGYCPGIPHKVPKEGQRARAPR